VTWRETCVRPLDPDPTDLTLLARAGHGCRAAVLASGLSRTWLNEFPLTKPGGLRVRNFVTSVALLRWAWEDGMASYTVLFPAEHGWLLILY
jgi:hypothetical protein